MVAQYHSGHSNMNNWIINVLSKKNAMVTRPFLIFIWYGGDWVPIHPVLLSLELRQCHYPGRNFTSWRYQHVRDIPQEWLVLLCEERDGLPRSTGSSTPSYTDENWYAYKGLSVTRNLHQMHKCKQPMVSKTIVTADKLNGAHLYQIRIQLKKEPNRQVDEVHSTGN